MNDQDWIDLRFAHAIRTGFLVGVAGGSLLTFVVVTIYRELS